MTVRNTLAHTERVGAAHPRFTGASVVRDPKPFGARTPRTNTDSDAPWTNRNEVDLGVDGHLLHLSVPCANCNPSNFHLDVSVFSSCKGSLININSEV